MSWNLFDSLFKSRAEREYEQKCRDRPCLTDDQFVDQFYAGIAMNCQVAIRLRRIYAEQLGMDRMYPDDDAARIFPDLDLIEIVGEVEEEFGIKLTDVDLDEMEGTFDWMVKCVNKKLTNQGMAN